MTSQASIAVTRLSRWAFAGLAVLIITPGCHRAPKSTARTELEVQGREIFRYDTFGNERFWTDSAGLLELVDKRVEPPEALRLGLKVDMEKLDLAKFVVSNPFSTGGTKDLLKRDAVVGLKATFSKDGGLEKVGITCALCHSTVDDALLPGIGHRLDGWPNRDLEVGKILSMLPIFTPEQKKILESWPKGTYDPRFNVDGKSTPLVLPPAYGLAGVTNETYTAEGPISYWNAYVAITQMHGRGTFKDPRIGLNIVQTPDLVTPKLPALRAYQHSLPAPKSSFDNSEAARGKVVFDANCARCHVGGTLTDNNNNGMLHAASETGMDAAYAERTSQKKYRTTPLRGLAKHPPYFHDGSARTLEDVIAHYAKALNLQLTERQRKDLQEYLKSL
jgi:mono/diheme cytochrome c family protein